MSPILDGLSHQRPANELNLADDDAKEDKLQSFFSKVEMFDFFLKIEFLPRMPPASFTNIILVEPINRQFHNLLSRPSWISNGPTQQIVNTPLLSNEKLGTMYQFYNSSAPYNTNEQFALSSLVTPQSAS